MIYQKNNRIIRLNISKIRLLSKCFLYNNKSKLYTHKKASRVRLIDVILIRFVFIYLEYYEFNL